ncbi:hypothetical protein Misp01_20390 [Microtetraspora sp. NBRC 13810]|uniref:DUF3817 domain-containing protein n=1 Tax=Microtetraspora sp. NBRC 13810 TaxID=3030990 RepID=UPI0024A4D326|nr:DUF3817 domain-containing protein [Microtetraspora sp. NBRC 13810]GLW06909.1 hypothetical protein Misp01_20390 [Microtetraspora sp. NBRC 13810]
MPLPKTLQLFRFAAIAEAFSWAGLLVGMFFKYVVVGNEIGVQIFGPIHGGLFVVYVVAVFAAARAAGWGAGVVVLGLACAVPPFTSVWFERRMIARHLAAVPAGRQDAAPVA